MRIYRIKDMKEDKTNGPFDILGYEVGLGKLICPKVSQKKYLFPEWPEKHLL